MDISGNDFYVNDNRNNFIVRLFVLSFKRVFMIERFNFKRDMNICNSLKLKIKFINNR